MRKRESMDLFEGRSRRSSWCAGGSFFKFKSSLTVYPETTLDASAEFGNRVIMLEHPSDTLKR